MPRPSPRVSYVAFLRAINVAGHATVKMADLQEVFGQAGAWKVRTVIQSGNVLFEGVPRAEALFRRIRKAVGVLIGAEPVILFRRLEDVRMVVDANPFAAVDRRQDLKLYVVFLAEAPKAVPALPLRVPKESLTLIAVNGLEAFVVSGRKANGFYGFPNAFIESALGVAATSRNWSTVSRIAALRD